jgi:hypothetical protein
MQKATRASFAIEQENHDIAAAQASTPMKQSRKLLRYQASIAELDAASDDKLLRGCERRANYPESDATP